MLIKLHKDKHPLNVIEITYQLIYTIVNWLLVVKTIRTKTNF